MNIFILDMEMSWALSLFRSLFAFLDYLIYSVIRILFKTMFQLANFELTGFYEEMLERVYVILGIFMLFKVTISLITYLVNPDKITDKEQGASKLITRILTVLVMLILLPNIFTLLTEFQNKALPVIPRIIIGTSFESDADAITSADNVAKAMSIEMVQGFAHAKDGCGVPEFNNLEEFLSGINETCEQGGKKIYAYDYLPVISTLVGAVMCYVVVSLNITVAIRAFKLIILKMIAPIPIVSYIDPKSSKDGTFSTWVKTFTSTWAELFMYVAIVYFIIFMLDYIFSTDAWNGFFTSAGIDATTGGVGMAVEVVIFLAFIVIGLLFFARQAPKFLMDALGIKSKGNFMRMLGMGAGAAGMLGSTRASLRARNEYDADNDPDGKVHHLRNLGASLFSGIASGEAAGNALLTTDKPNLLTGYDAHAKHNATMLSRISSGSTLGGRLGTMGQTLVFGQSDYDRMTREIESYEEANKALVAYKNDLEKKALEQIGDGKKGIRVSVEDAFGNVHSGLNYNEFVTHSQGAQNGNAESLQWFIDHGWSKQVQAGFKRVWDAGSHSYINQPVYETIADWQSAQAIIEDLKTAQINEHAKRVVNGHNGMSGEEYDGTSYNTYRLAENASDGVSGLDVNFASLSSVKKNLGVTNREVTNRKIDPKYKAAAANAKATKK